VRSACPRRRRRRRGLAHRADHAGEDTSRLRLGQRGCKTQEAGAVVSRTNNASPSATHRPLPRGRFALAALLRMIRERQDMTSSGVAADGRDDLRRATSLGRASVGGLAYSSHHSVSSVAATPRALTDSAAHYSPDMMIPSPASRFLSAATVAAGAASRNRRLCLRDRDASNTSGRTRLGLGCSGDTAAHAMFVSFHRRRRVQCRWSEAGDCAGAAR